MALTLAACGDPDPGNGFSSVSITQSPAPASETGSATGDAPSTTGDALPTTGAHASSSTGAPTNSSTGDDTPGTTGATATTGPTDDPVCGDGQQTGDEECDLGAANADNGACTTNCRLPVCGDGHVQAGVEQCDDGGTQAGDGCDPECWFEGEAADVEVPQFGLGLAIPNDGYDGFPNSMACADLPVETVGVVKDVRVQVGIDHPFIGDLVIKLWSPKGTQLTLMSLPGGAEEADDGKSDSTEGSDISSSWPVTFKEDGEIAELMGHTLGLDETVCRDDGVCDYAPYPGKGPGKDFGDFTGEPAQGTWRLCVGDAAFADKGTFESVVLFLDL